MEASGAKPIEFEYSGEVYQVGFSTNALCSLEDEFGGMSIAAVGEMVASGSGGVRGARALFRAALFDGRPDLSPVAAGLIMEELGPDRTAELIQEAFERLKAGMEATVKLPSPDARGRLSFEAAGLRLTLSFHMNAQAEMEAYFAGLNPEQILARLESKGASLSDLRALFRSALVDFREVTLADAGAIMDRIGVKVAGDAVKVAYLAAFPKKAPEEDEEETPGNRAQRRAAASKARPTKAPAGGGTGRRSTSSGARKKR